ncbi:MAG: hypothetical protein AAGK17_01980 [Pseudomonadota bacterium]
MPDDLNEAAKFCYFTDFLDYKRHHRINDEEVKPIEELSSQSAYLMIAASKSPQFDIGSLEKQTEGLSAYAVEVRTQMHEWSDEELENNLSVCKTRFGISGSLAIPTLPEADEEAAFNCAVASSNTTAILKAGGFDSNGRDRELWDLQKRLFENAEVFNILGDQDIFDSEERVVPALRQVYSQGDLLAYVAACKARFPIKPR